MARRFCSPSTRAARGPDRHGHERVPELIGAHVYSRCHSQRRSADTHWARPFRLANARLEPAGEAADLRLVQPQLGDVLPLALACTDLKLALDDVEDLFDLAMNVIAGVEAWSGGEFEERRPAAGALTLGLIGYLRTAQRNGLTLAGDGRTRGWSRDRRFTSRTPGASLAAPRRRRKSGMAAQITDLRNVRARRANAALFGELENIPCTAAPGLPAPAGGKPFPAPRTHLRRSVR
jgi:hypothetical protein